MDFLLVGASRFATRRVLPAARAVDGIERIHVASRRGRTAVAAGVDKVFRSWEDALDQLPRCLVYVSVVNGLHADVVESALRCGHHVVVDKPALPDLTTTARLVALAERNGSVLAEGLCYPFHPLFGAVREVLVEHRASLSTAVAMFTPPVPTDDWRWDASAGGGAIADLGPYAASVGRVLWDTEPTSVGLVVNARGHSGVVSSFSVLAEYSGGRSVIGRFGFTMPYRNELHLAGDGISIDVDRAFSAPPDYAVNLRVATKGQDHDRAVPPADSMAAFLQEVVDQADDPSGMHAERMLGDARVRHRLERAASASAAAIAG